jgi:hypothetical protein
MSEVSEVSESTDLPQISGPGPNMAQVDPPHPFKSALKTLIIAAIAVSIALGLYVWLGQKPPVASGEVLASNVYPVHWTINNGAGGNDGMAGTSESNDQVIILTKIKIRNQTDIPLFMQDIGSAIKLPDGSEQTNVAASDKDMDRVFQAYPSLSYLRGDPIPRDITLSPGQSAEGLAIFNYPITKEQWDTLQTAKVVVQFMHQKNLEINIGR